MKHHCHALECPNPCPPKHLMCAGCWAQVPPELQREVYRTVKLRDPRAIDETWAPWWRAQARAIAYVAVASGVRSLDWKEGYVRHEDHVADEMEAP